MIPAVLQLQRPNDQTIAPNTNTPIIWTLATTEWGWTPPDLPATIIPVPIDGLYRINTGVWWDGNTSGRRDLFITGGGNEAEPYFYITPVNVLVGTPQFITASIWLLTTSTLEIQVRQTSVANRTLIGATNGRIPTVTLQLIREGTPNP